jgi:pimeloyl-ACP methyl ester carboxylesterase
VTAPFDRCWTRAVTAIGVGLVLLLGGCTSGADDDASSDPATAAPDSEVPTSETPTPDDPGSTQPGGVRRFYNQALGWEPCGNVECATVQVPVDYANLQGDTVDLAVNRRRADGDAPAGSILVNPGGPGSSGVDYLPQAVAQMGPSVLERYDVVGFDPRGVGKSDPIECLDTEGVDALLAADPTPDDAAEVDKAAALLEALGDECARAAGPLLPHLSTTEVARDLDVLRAVLGDDRLSYYGASYGTFIGALYAELFPKRVGRLVLDGALDPALNLEQLNQQQAAGFETALTAYLESCVSAADCPLGSDVDSARRRVSEFLDALDADPLPTSGDRELTEGLGLYGVSLPLYVPQLWSLLNQALDQAITDGDGSMLLSFADLYWHRTDDGYSDNLAQAIYAVNCLDNPTDATEASITASLPEFEQASPTFGRVFAWSQLGCAQWPVEAESPTPAIDGAGAAPILVVGTTRDPATPYAWAQALAEQLESAVLLTRDGDGHTAYGQGNDCIDSAIDAYLSRGTAPRDGSRC